MLMRCSKSESLPHLTTVWRRRKAPWDQPISGETLEKWLDWKSSLPLLREITVPRCYLSRLEHKGVTFQLQHFCDASESGYGTVSYLRFAYLDGFTECAFVTGKSIGKSPLLALIITKKVNTFFTCFDWLAWRIKHLLFTSASRYSCN